MSQLRSSPLKVPCPQCGRTIHTTYGRLVDEATVHCPAGHAVKLVDQGDGARRADRELDNFKREMDRLNRRLRRIGRH